MGLIEDITNNLLLQAGGKPLIEPTNYIMVEPHEKQKLFLGLDDVREALFGGATGGGKTIALLADALKFAHVKDYSALLLRRSFPDLKQEGGLIDVAHGWLNKTDAKWNEQDKQWNFPSGASLRFGFLDVEVDKYRYQGGEYQYIGFDEVTQFTESSYRYLFSRLRKKASLNVPLRMRAATNPGGVGGAWVYERFIPEDFSPIRAGELKVWTKTLENGATTAFVPSLLDDNPSLDKEAYLESLMELDEITREQYLKGDWLIQVRGDILYTYSEAHSVISWSQFANIFGEREIPAHWQVQVTQDWGCLTMDTEILTKRGWKKHNELVVGEPVASCDWQNNQAIVWTPLNKVIYKHEQPLVELKSKSFKFVCTPDHAWIVKRRKRGKMKQSTVRRQRLDEIAPSHTSFLVARPCSDDGDLDVSPYEAAVLGWLVTDGWVANGIAYLCQKNYPESLMYTLNKSGLEWKELTEKPNGTRIFRLTKSAFKDLRNKTGYADKSDLPSIVTRLSPSARQAMMDAMLLAEGTNNGTSRKSIFCQKRGYEMDAFQILASLCGQRLGIEREHQSEYGKSNRVSLLRNPFIDYPQITTLDGVHDVWCPSVNEGSVIARQNGQITITGNTTPDHPCITSWFATAGRNAPVINGVPLSECVFLYRGLMLTQCTAADVAKEIIQLMKHRGEASRCTSWRMSHEASSERMEYHQQGLPFTNWKTGKTRGIEQLKDAFSLRYTDKPHPFKPTLYGTPRLFLIVDDQELTYPRTDAGLARWRAEIPAYHTKVPKTGEVAVKWEPYPLFNDAVDTMREAAAEYFPSSTDLTKAEKLLEKMPDMFKTEELDEHAKVAKMLWLQREAQEQEQPKEERFSLW